MTFIRTPLLTSFPINESGPVFYLSQGVPGLICLFNGPHYERITHYNNSRRQEAVDGDIDPG